MKDRTPSILFASLTAITLMIAVPASFGAETGGTGRDLTRTRCKGCHAEGAAAGTMTPLSKTQRQWERFFDKEQHEKRAPGQWKEISPKELEQIRTYLIEHAADSPHPETCG
jgi:mono/diheme cytochrome c family protein